MYKVIHCELKCERIPCTENVPDLREKSMSVYLFFRYITVSLAEDRGKGKGKGEKGKGRERIEYRNEGRGKRGGRGIQARRVERK